MRLSLTGSVRKVDRGYCGHFWVGSWPCFDYVLILEPSESKILGPLIISRKGIAIPLTESEAQFLFCMIYELVVDHLATGSFGQASSALIDLGATVIVDGMMDVHPETIEILDSKQEEFTQ